VLEALFPTLHAVCLSAFISTVVLSNKWHTRWFIIFRMNITITSYSRSNTVWTKINTTCIICYLPSLPSKKIISQLKKLHFAPTDQESWYSVRSFLLPRRGVLSNTCNPRILLRYIYSDAPYLEAAIRGCAMLWCQELTWHERISRKEIFKTMNVVKWRTVFKGGYSAASGLKTSNAVFFSVK
jgi:hypothetical protein